MDNSILITSSAESANLSTRSSIANPNSYHSKYDPYTSMNTPNTNSTNIPNTNNNMDNSYANSCLNWTSTNNSNLNNTNITGNSTNSINNNNNNNTNNTNNTTTNNNNNNNNQFSIDIWNSSLSKDLHNLNSSNSNLNLNLNPNSNSTANSNYNTVSTFNTSISNPVNDPNNIYNSKFSNVEMDPLAFQMLQLSTTQKDSLSHMNSTPSMIQNPYFNNSNVGFNRQIKDNLKNHLSNNNNNNNNNNNTVTDNSTNTVNWSNNSNANTSNNNNNYSNYLLQQQKQLQRQASFANQNTFKVNKQQNHSINQNQNIQSPLQLQSVDETMGNNKVYNNYDSRVLKLNQPISSDIDSSEIENYKTKIQLKDIIISKLEFELGKLKDFQNTILKTQKESNGNFEIPKNYEDLYHKLVEKINSTESELQDTKTRLESLITAISMNPNPSTYKNGRYDEEEISHKIISKLKMLTEENDELSRMVSYGKSKEKDIEIALLRKQNNDLLEKVAKLETKLNDKK